MDNIWRMDLLVINNYGPRNNKSYRFSLVANEHLSKIRWIIALKNKIDHTVKNYFADTFITSKRSQILIETDDGEEFPTKFFNAFLKKLLSKL